MTTPTPEEAAPTPVGDTRAKPARTSAGAADTDADIDAVDPPATGTEAAVETDEQRRLRRPSRRALSLVAVPLVALVIMQQVGGAIAPSLVDTHPAWLLALNASNRHLILTTNALDPWTYYGVGMLRLLVSDPLFFLLGYWYGDAAVTWMEKRTQTWGDMLRTLERFFGKAGYPLVFLAPNNAICLFSGAAGMSLRAFVALNVTGTVARLYVFRRFGEAFQEPIDDFVGWIGDHRVPLLIASVALTAISVALEAKRGETEVTALAHLDEELPETDQELHDTPSPTPDP